MATCMNCFKRNAMPKLARVLPSSRHDFNTTATTTLNCTINAYIRQGNLDYARYLFDQNPSLLNVISWNSMISGCMKHDQIQHAQKLFDQMPKRDVVSWNTMLSGLNKTGNSDGIYRCFLQMGRDGLRPNEFTFSLTISSILNTAFKPLIPQLHCLIIFLGLNLSVFVGSALMRGYADLRDSIGLCQVFDEVLVKDITSWNALMLGFMDLGLTGEARRTFDLMPDKNVVSWTTLVNGYIRNKNIDEARSIFDQNNDRNVVLWTAMLSGYVQYGKFVQALELFIDMMKSGNRPNHFTFSSVLDACAGCSSLLLGKQIHSNVLKSGFPLDIILSTSLVDMYAKCGEIETAFNVFESMPKKNLVSWNSIIGGYARHGLGTRALEEFHKMTTVGFYPDRITFVNVLSACVHGGLVEEGERHFNSMATKYGIEAEMEHYACLVDLYGRAGYLNKAVELTEGMPFEPDVVVWGALLAACGLHCDLEFSEFAAKELSKVEKDHPAVYSMLSKIYSEKGKWGSVFELKKMMKEWRAKKQKAGSWIESSVSVQQRKD